jgi:hypothetical protein
MKNDEDKQSETCDICFIGRYTFSSTGPDGNREHFAKVLPPVGSVDKADKYFWQGSVVGMLLMEGKTERQTKK